MLKHFHSRVFLSFSPFVKSSNIFVSFTKVDCVTRGMRCIWRMRGFTRPRPLPALVICPFVGRETGKMGQDRQDSRSGVRELREQLKTPPGWTLDPSFVPRPSEDEMAPLCPEHQHCWHRRSGGFLGVQWGSQLRFQPCRGVGGDLSLTLLLPLCVTPGRWCPEVTISDPRASGTTQSQVAPRVSSVPCLLSHCPKHPPDYPQRAPLPSPAPWTPPDHPQAAHDAHPLGSTAREEHSCNCQLRLGPPDKMVSLSQNGYS